MKQIIGAIVAAGALAACNGGSASPPPFSTGVAQPTPASSPVVYSAKLLWTGGVAAAHGATAYDRFVQDARSIRDAGFASPVLIVAPYSSAVSVVGGNGSGALLIVQASPASPAPSVSPGSVTFSVPVSNVATSGSPQPSATAGVIATQNIVVTTPGTQAHGNASATISAPVSATPTIPVIVYNNIAMGCAPIIQVPQIPGRIVNDDGSTTRDDNPAHDDLYITGSYCPGAFNDPTASSTDNAVLHAPYGAVVLATLPAGGFSAITASQFTGTTTTTLHYADVQPAIAVLFKNHNGKTCKLTLSAGALAANQTDIQGPVACSGSSPDSF